MVATAVFIALTCNVKKLPYASPPPQSATHPSCGGGGFSDTSRMLLAATRVVTGWDSRQTMMDPWPRPMTASSTPLMPGRR